ncbi:RNA-guided pseudouridylation complex pseudouridine synthase subunit Cbf5 [archaeon]|nr:RNA-guided pseudouridylation complex pseudouridine synthase subunit Cbf5 [archaeon]PJC45376.1 MAG: RNA-guided pseudouridylation complex pseudouridine synthase subunit Cbf5 [Candidatus Pacearchaeota archaeon CG_4_9_14_0_2_um_filter_30_8]
MTKPDIQKIKDSKTIKELLEFSIINIDKPVGPTSFNVSDFVHKALSLRKTSHFGTLDPKVTGVLPIALNRSCKLTGYFLGEDKTYVGIARFHEEVELKKIEEAIKENFSGIITQMPPVKSRVKRQFREREIHSFKLLEKRGKDILFSAKVQGGTYIRKLIDDLGKVLGIGAHMLELRRTNAGIFFEDDKNFPIINLYDFEKAVSEYKNGNEELLRKILIPAEIVSVVYDLIEIKKDNLEKIYTGKPIYFEDLVKKVDLEKETKISVFSGSKFVGMYKVVNDGDIFAKGEFVMQEIRN